LGNIPRDPSKNQEKAWKRYKAIMLKAEQQLDEAENDERYTILNKEQNSFLRNRITKNQGY